MDDNLELIHPTDDNIQTLKLEQLTEIKTSIIVTCIVIKDHTTQDTRNVLSAKDAVERKQ